ncbi:MAG: DNA mismatch repair protein [Spirochaetia bacterium]|jgi:DNA mismatch repair protein MutH|nr:DNA mismatch repair protein [Spirochaetia bacterium]
MEYDSRSKNSIIAYARRLEGHTIEETNGTYGTYEGSSPLGEFAPDYKSYKGKGQFGQFLEEQYFGLANNSESRPDFKEVGLELKASPLKVLKNGQVRVKERLVLNHFTYFDIAKETFETSHFKMKDAFILLVFYFYERGIKLQLLKVDLVDLWECLKEDEEQIREDWQIIVNKVKAGKAEEISEGDTLYLGACTKGATAATSMQSQPYSSVKARGRALCFKQSYINHIYKILSVRKKKRKAPLNIPHFVKNKNITFEQNINNLCAPYIGRSFKDIAEELEISLTAKNRYALLARAILGYKKGDKSFYEFDAADIQVKTIRVEGDGKIREHMSFRPIVYTDIVNEEWEDSDFYQELVSKFIFVIFRKIKDASDYYLSEVKFWNMPEKDLEIVHGVWEDAKRCIAEDDFRNLPKISEHRIAHVRTHARKGNDKQETPSGRMECKRSFWLNREYIIEKII